MTPTATGQTQTSGGLMGGGPGAARAGRRPGAWIVPALMATAGVAVLWSTSSGPGLSPDSVVYVNAADSWLAGSGLEAFGRPVTLWPPGYPLLLGLMMHLGIGLQTGIVALGVAAATLTVWLTHRLGRAVGLGPWGAVTSAAVVALGVWTVRVSSMAWSEPLFLVVVLATLLTCSRWLSRSPRWWEVGVVAALVSLACVLRYAGVALLPAVVLGCVVGLRRGSTPVWGRTVALAVGSSAGLAAVVAHNLSLGVGPTGDRVGTGMSPVRAVGHLLRALGQAVVPEPGGPMPLVAGGVGPRVTLVLTAVWFVFGGLVLLLFLCGVVSQLRMPLGPGACTTAFSTTYVAVLLYATVSAGVDPPNERLLQPVLPAVVVLGALGGRDVARRWVSRHAARDRADGDRGMDAAARRAGVWRRRAGVVLVVWALASTAGTAVVASRASRDGIGYNSESVERSPLTAAIRRVAVTDGVALSDPWQGYWILRRDVVSLYEGDLVERVRAGAVNHLVLYPGSTNEDVSVPALRARGIDLQPVSAGADGALYRVAVIGSP